MHKVSDRKQRIITGRKISAPVSTQIYTILQFRRDDFAIPSIFNPAQHQPSSRVTGYERTIQSLAAR